MAANADRGKEVRLEKKFIPNPDNPYEVRLRKLKDDKIAREKRRQHRKAVKRESELFSDLYRYFVEEKGADLHPLAETNASSSSSSMQNR